MANRRPSLRVVFGRLVFAALPLAGAGCAPGVTNTCLAAYPNGALVTIDGGIPDGSLTDDQPGSSEICAAYCPQGQNWEFCERREANVILCQCPVESRVFGRAPAGMLPARGNAATPLGRYFAQAAHLEAAAVLAFRGLAAETQGHGAPSGLVGSLERAARDEVRHARTMGRLARLHGADVPPVEVNAPGARTLEAIALENASEGCVYETHAALVATWQAQNASLPALRRAMSVIAEDETRHAETSWALARWLNGSLSGDERARVASARHVALERLERTAMLKEDPEVALHTGFPQGAVAARLVQGLAREIMELGRALDA